MRKTSATDLPLLTLDAAELLTVSGGENKTKAKEKSLGEKINEGGRKFVEEGYKWAGELVKIAKGSKLGAGPGLVSPGIIAKANNDLAPASKS